MKRWFEIEWPDGAVPLTLDALQDFLSSPCENTIREAYKVTREADIIDRWEQVGDMYGSLREIRRTLKDPLFGHQYLFLLRVSYQVGLGLEGTENAP